MTKYRVTYRMVCSGTVVVSAKDEAQAERAVRDLLSCVSLAKTASDVDTEVTSATEVADEPA